MDGITVTPKAIDTPSVNYVADDIHPVAQFLGLDTHKLADSDIAAIQDIQSFLRGEAKEMTQLEMLHKVRELEQKLGMTSLGERRIDKVFRYVKLQKQIDSLSAQRDRELR